MTITRIHVAYAVAFMAMYGIVKYAIFPHVGL